MGLHVPSRLAPATTRLRAATFADDDRGGAPRGRPPPRPPRRTRPPPPRPRPRRPVDASRVLSGTVLVAGNMVGGGLLAMPTVTMAAGFYPSVGALLAIWGVMCLLGLLLAEVSVNAMAAAAARAESRGGARRPRAYHHVSKMAMCEATVGARRVGRVAHLHGPPTARCSRATCPRAAACSRGQPLAASGGAPPAARPAARRHTRWPAGAMAPRTALRGPRRCARARASSRYAREPPASLLWAPEIDRAC